VGYENMVHRYGDAGRDEALMEDFTGYDWRDERLPRWLRVLLWCAGIAIVVIAGGLFLATR
jgi:hypothetical protein